MSIRSELAKIPPVTRFLCGSSLLVSVPVMLHIVSPYAVVFGKELVTKRWEIWRLYTSFFFSGGGISYLFDFIMLYRTASALESTHYPSPTRTARLAYHLLLTSASIILLSLPLNAATHTRSLLLALTYVSAALAPPSAQYSLFGLVTLPAMYTPYVLTALDLLIAGPTAAAQAVVGCVAGHLWSWGVFGASAGFGGGATATGGVLRESVEPPRWFMNLFPGSTPEAAGGARVVATGGGVQMITPRTRAAPNTGGSTSGYNWGSGNRLGSD